MESIGVLMVVPTNSYLESELNRRYNLFRFWNYPDRKQFLAENAKSIRAVVGNAFGGADAELIEALPKLEIVSSFSVGLDKIDLGKCKEKGIRVTNTPDVLTEDVADLAVGLMISVLRRIPQCDRYVRSGTWKRGDFKLTTKFTGKRVGIIGLGRIGSAIAVRAEAFDCPISYYSRTRKPDSKYTYYPNVLELASNCDILVIACPLNKETRHIVNREVINALGPKGVLINIGRGPHVDEPELVAALVEGRLGGAGLDVFEHEPHVPEELFNLENVVLLPHVGSATVETRTSMANLVLGNLDAHFNGSRFRVDALGEEGVLINIGRGSHVDEPELVAALVEKRLGGAGLDVFEDEPNLPQELFELDNVVLQPHVGSSTIESRIAMTNLVLANLNAHFTSAALLSKVA